MRYAPRIYMKHNLVALLAFLARLVRNLCMFSAAFAMCAGSAAAQSSNGLVFNYEFGYGPGSNHSILIATLPPSTAQTYDHLRLVVTMNTLEYSTANSYIDATFANRNGFAYTYTLKGAPVNPAATLVAYSQSDGSVNIYLNFLSQYVLGSYTVLENVEETVYTSPADSGGNIPGSLIFDSSNPSYPPQTYTAFNGYFGLGNMSPQATLHVSSPDVQAASSLQPFGNGNVVIQGTGSRSLTAGSALTFAMAANLDGSNTWEQARLLATADTNNNADASGRLALQTRYIDSSSNWQWRNNLVLSSSGNVGVGTTTPGAPLDVVGAIRTSGGFIFPDGSVQSTAFTSGAPLTIASPQAASNVVLGAFLDSALPNGGLAQIQFGQSQAPNADGTLIYTYNSTTPALSYVSLGTFANSFSLNVTGSGRVGIGTVSPHAELEVNGNMMLTAGSGASITFADGTVQSTAYTGTCPTTGGDYAESVDVSGDRREFTPGDVMVVDPTNPGHFLRSTTPYSPLVAGIYSTKPGYIGRRQLSDPRTAITEVPMAMVGIVPTKVTSENGPIKVGDLLVTSSTSGYAMHGTNTAAMTGAIVGKSLGSLESGIGVIEVLVSLQ